MCGRATVINPDGITEKLYGYTKKFVPSDWTEGKQEVRQEICNRRRSAGTGDVVVYFKAGRPAHAALVELLGWLEESVDSDDGIPAG